MKDNSNRKYSMAFRNLDFNTYRAMKIMVDKPQQSKHLYFT